MPNIRSAPHCEFYSDCRTCPFPDCVEVIGRVAVKQWGQRMEIQGLKEKGLKLEEIAKVLGVTVKTIYRRLEEKSRNGGDAK